jgi:hypothetical protein
MTRELNRAGAPSGAPAPHPTAEFPWKREPGRCELCGERTAVLYRIVIAPAEPRKRRRARVAYCCSRHHRGSNGEPVPTPSSSMAPGTSRLKPQAEALFDSAPYRRGGAS